MNNEIYLIKIPCDLFEQIIQKIKKKFPNEILFHIKEYGYNFLKKLKQLIKLINLLKNQIKSKNENQVLENKMIVLYKFFLKKSSSSYLRLEHCQELFDLINV